MVQYKTPFCYSLGKHGESYGNASLILESSDVDLCFFRVLYPYPTFLLDLPQIPPFHHLHVVLHVVPLSQKMGLGRDAVRNVGMRAVSSTSSRTVC